MMQRLACFSMTVAAVVGAASLYAQRPRYTIQTSTGPAETAAGAVSPEPNNIFGAHLLVEEGKPGTRGYDHLRWARHLVGKWGYAKTMFTGITKKTHGPRQNWIDYVDSCYTLELIPLVRLAGVYGQGGWAAPIADAPGDYHSMAAAIKSVVEGLPRSNKCPLYVEVWNEPNLGVEWSGKSNPKEYADFFVETAAAIRSIGDPRIRILNGGLATNFEWAEQMCKANPLFATSFDVWSSHPYPQSHPPSVNHHDKTAPDKAYQTIDSYLLELDVLKRYGRKNVPVMITETGYDLGNSVFASQGYPIIDELNRADYMVRAFRDYWPKWPEVVAVFPFEFCDKNWQRFNWVHPDSKTKPDGSPTRPHLQYTAVAALAKPTDPTGAISGTITIDKLGVPLEGARVVVDFERQGALTDPMGNYILPPLAPGKYRVFVDKSGFGSIEKKVEVTAGANAVVDVALVAREKVSLTGVVRSGDDDKPLSRVQVELSPGGQVARTDAKGRYEFPACIPARYTIKARSAQRLTYLSVVSVAAHGRSVHNFVLGRQQVTGPENMLQNASMESGGGGGGKAGIALGFEPFTGEYRENLSSVDDKFAHTGRLAQAIRMQPEEIAVRQITHYGTARPGTTYLAGAWIRTDSPDKNGAAWISLAATDNGGGVITMVAPRQRVQGQSNGWGWQQVELTAPPGAQRLSLNLYTAGRTGTAYFDDVWLAATDKK